MKTEYLVDLQCPGEVVFGIIPFGELRHGELDLVVALLFIVLGRWDDSLVVVDGRRPLVHHAPLD